MTSESLKKKMVALFFHIKTLDFIEMCIPLDINIKYSADAIFWISQSGNSYGTVTFSK